MVLPACGIVRRRCGVPATNGSRERRASGSLRALSPSGGETGGRPLEHQDPWHPDRQRLQPSDRRRHRLHNRCRPDRGASLPTIASVDRPQAELPDKRRKKKRDGPGPFGMAVGALGFVIAIIMGVTGIVNISRARSHEPTSPRPAVEIPSTPLAMATVREWRVASLSDRLAAATRLVQAGSSLQGAALRAMAREVAICLNEAVAGDDMPATWLITDVAAICLHLIDG